MRSRSLQVNSVEELKNELETLSASDYKANVALVFCSVSYDLKEIRGLFSQFAIDLVGATTAGEICDEEVYDTSIVVLLMEMNKDFYRLDYQETGNRTTYQMAYEMGQQAKEQFANPAIIVVSGGMEVDGEKVVFGIKDGVGREVPLFGGMAADDLGMDKTFVFTNDCVTSDGLLCWIIDTDKIEVKGMAACGWEAIGAVNTVTEVEGNILKQINGEPALDVFFRYFGFFDNANNNNTEGVLTTISGQYPLQVMRENGDSILRSPIMCNDEDRSLLLAGGIKEGDKFRFSIAPGFEVIEDTIKEFSSLKDRAPEADAMILFSCKGRHAALGPLIEQEIEGLYNYWNTPMIGLFCYGEIGQTKEGICEFHNETCSLVMFHEK